MNLLPEIRNIKSVVAAAEDSLREPPLKRPRSYLGDIAISGATQLASSSTARETPDLAHGGEVIQARSCMSYGTNFQSASFRFRNESEAFTSHSVSSPRTSVDGHLSKSDQSQIHGIGLGLGLGSAPGKCPGGNLSRTPIPRTNDHAHYSPVPPTEAFHYKTKLCKHFKTGECKFRSGCSFAHSMEELRKHHGNDDEERKTLYHKLQAKPNANLNLVKQTDHINLPMMKTDLRSVKTKLCKYFQEGVCRFYGDCKFAHGKEELGMSLHQDTLNVPFKASIDQASIITKPVLGVVNQTSFGNKPMLGGEHHSVAVNKPMLGCVNQTSAVNTPMLGSVGGEHHTLAVNKPMLGCVDQTSALNTQMLGSVDQTRALTTAVLGRDNHAAPLNTAILASVNQISQVSRTMSGIFNQTSPLATLSSEANASTTSTADPTSSVNTTLTLSTYASSSVTENSGSTSGPIMGSTNTVVSVDDSSKDKKLKTKPCKFFQAGHCIYKEKCTFSHGECDNIINEHAEVGIGSTGNTGSDVNKSKDCKFFLQGKCHFGEKCIYNHNTDSSTASTNTIGNPKNRLCIWKEKGQSCPFGGKCVFAHSLPEIQNGTNSSTCTANRSNVNAISEMGGYSRTKEVVASFTGTNSSTCTANRSNVNAISEMEGHSRTKEVVSSFTESYSYQITDTNWRPFQSSTVTLNLLGNDLSKENERPVSSDIRMLQSGIHSSYTNLSYRTNWP